MLLCSNFFFSTVFQFWSSCSRARTKSSFLPTNQSVYRRTMITSPSNRSCFLEFVVSQPTGMPFVHVFTKYMYLDTNLAITPKNLATFELDSTVLIITYLCPKKIYYCYSYGIMRIPATRIRRAPCEGKGAQELYL